MHQKWVSTGRNQEVIDREDQNAQNPSIIEFHEMVAKPKGLGFDPWELVLMEGQMVQGPEPIY